MYKCNIIMECDVIYIFLGLEKSWKYDSIVVKTELKLLHILVFSSSFSSSDAASCSSRIVLVQVIA